ncbi:glycosyltransferase [Pseudomonas sp. UBA1879]|uniref:glycosyltransferase n=1 Tax=Pseudomonas sp. UBA1879 TaxID=1947305 RepID=UPI0025FE3100|nr:glycosyltransferase [Pseudomonas sp. UBA1879]
MPLPEQDGLAPSPRRAIAPISKTQALLPTKTSGAHQNKKVMFYTLPMVLRERPTLFSSIVDVYLPLANQFAVDGWDCVFVGTDELHREYPEFAHEWISPATMACQYPDWMRSDWLQDWAGILSGRSPEFHQEFVSTLIHRARPDLVFCWNFDSALETACSEYDISLLFNELGMLRAPNPLTYFSDPCGVNARSSFQTQFPQSNACSRALNLESAIARLRALEELYCPQGSARPSGCLILLQVRDDSNAITGSPFTAMADFVNCVLKAVAPSGMPITVKPHPLDDLPHLPDGVTVADKAASIEKLIGSVEVVFTLNSSAGFEAALAGKTVYVLGDAAYSNIGLTVDVPNPCALPEAWDNHKNSFTPDLELRARALYFAERYYFLSPAQFIEPLCHFEKLKYQGSRGANTRDIEKSDGFQQHTLVNRLKNINKAHKAEFARLSAETTACKAEMQAQIKWLTQSLTAMERSNSWRVTRPIRAASAKLGEYRAFLRDYYQRKTFLLILKIRLERARAYAKKTVSATFHSKNNAKALQALTDRRFSYSLAPRRSAPNEPIIDISIVTYNSAKWVDRFIHSLTTQAYPLNKVRLYFVDNGSTDDTVRHLERWREQLSGAVANFQIVVGANVGFGGGHDRVMRNSEAEFVLVTNIDIEFTDQAIHTLVAAAGEDSNCEIASWEARQAPYEHPKYYDPVTLEVNWSSHACVLIRRAAYLSCGGYEPKIFMYGEDVEISYRFRSYGYRLRYCPSALVHHYTYESEAQVKPLQYRGSTLANLYIRWRYGDITDRVAGVLLQGWLLFSPSAYTNARRHLISNACTFVKNIVHFSKGKGPRGEEGYPFRAFDYEMTRGGAFWPVGKSLSALPKVTVVTRTYRKREKFLRQSIISVINQTYPNIELIIVEDGGKTTQPLVAEFMTMPNVNIRYYGLEKVGRSVTGNHGLEMATGEYCMFLDDDDLLFSDHVEVLVSSMLDNPQAAAAYSQSIEIATNVDDQGYYDEVSHVEPETFKHSFDYNILLDHNFIPIQSLLFKRSLFLNRGGFETDMDHLEDWNLWLRYGFNNTFSYVAKTTSLFRTPADFSTRKDRHMQLHNAYFIAKNRAIESCKSYSQDLNQMA